MSRFIESRHVTPGQGGRNEHAAGAAAHFERLSSLSAEIEVELYISPQVVCREVIVQLRNFSMGVVASFRGHPLLLPLYYDDWYTTPREN
jgi:hypothetical protein